MDHLVFHLHQLRTVAIATTVPMATISKNTDGVVGNGSNGENGTNGTASGDMHWHQCSHSLTPLSLLVQLASLWPLAPVMPKLTPQYPKLSYQLPKLTP